ncbi:MAG: class I SAM-dependent methyltransferase, partial [Acidobacteria bacterium]|nr:class I SAM-dependent methyltransferase [Acidobacteriota bacterium]
VDRMLAMAEAGQDDVLYDLGCGDGRIVIEAARRFGTRGIGADLNPQRLADAKRNAQEAGVENRVRFLHTDATSLDLSEATIVTLYVAGSAALQLREKFEKELRPGARILANSCDVGEWEKCDVVIADGMPWTIYLWRVNLGIPFLSKWEARKA